MIQGWRRAFSKMDVPFNFVQLHACDDFNDGQCYADFCNYGDIRMAEDDTQRYTDNVGMAVAFDHGHVGIHSPHKAEVAARLGAKVLSTAYGLAAPGAADGPTLVGACVLAAPPAANGRNVTTIKIKLANTNGNLTLGPTDECAVQSPQCCNVTTPGLRGVALGVAEVAVGSVWKGQQWYPATMEPADDALLLHADLGNQVHPWSPAPEDDPVWQVRFTFGAFPSCAVYNSHHIPLAPFGPLAVAPACSFDQLKQQRRRRPQHP